MKRAAILLGALSLLLAVSCKEEKEKPKVIYEEERPSAKRTDSGQGDSTDIKVADLPILMEGTKYLIHPVGDVRIYDNKKSYGSSRTNDFSYAISNYTQFEITGYFENLRFQHVDSTAMHSLTDKHVQIQTATLLNSGIGKAKKQFLVYTLVDADTNRDGRVDANDIRSLYMSDSGGNNFRKISSDMHELIDWNVIDAQSRLYFRTIEDINKNGAFDRNDAVHYHYADLTSPEWIVSEYKPVE